MGKITAGQIPSPASSGLATTGSSPPEARQLARPDPDLICATVARYYGLEPSSLPHRREPHTAPPVAARICRRHAEVSLRELAGRFGLHMPTSFLI